ncbi:S1 family peptidase [Paenibacillus caui]|uniref:S1 family peptidase n=1 Tax=Paenibacillus caui TaxID=2873927 RepID=UPI001F491F3B|nr:S1 family peptidase [Paenibacillus caui]
MADFRAANLMKERLSRQLLKQRGIHAVGVGYRHPGKPRRGAAVIVYTGSFSSSGLSKIKPERKHTKSMRFKGKKISVPIRYVQAQKFRAHAAHGSNYTRRIRPVIAGYSVGTDNESGTAGLIVSGKGGSRYLLSNNHVLNKNNRSGYTATLQPGGADGGTVQRDKIGRLYRFVKLKKKGTNYIDAALSLPIRRSILSPRYAKFGALPGHVASYRVGERFKKVGRTTGLVYGTVDSINTDVRVSYGDFGNLGEILFKNQSIIRGDKPVSLAGDSGSVWLRSKDNYAAAVNFAGSDNGKLSISFPVQWALKTFGVRVAKPRRSRRGSRKIRGSKHSYMKSLTAKERSNLRIIIAH